MTTRTARMIEGALTLGGLALVGEHIREAKQARRLTADGQRATGTGGHFTCGKGRPIQLALYGDSVLASIEPGSVARRLAESIAQAGYRVTVDDYAKDGQRAEHLRQQLAGHAMHRPNLAVICVGGNDVIHPRPLHRFAEYLRSAIGDLRRPQPGLPIVLIGAPDMSTVPAFGPFERHEFGWRARQVNRKTAQVARKTQVQFSNLAERAGWFFRDHPEVAFAPDQYHPSEEGNSIIVKYLMEDVAKVIRLTDISQAA